MPLPGDDSDFGDHRPLAEINVTPLVDVMLVMLIIFMVTAPMLTAGLPMDLPQAGAARPLARNPAVIVTVTKDGRTLIGQDEVPLEQLAAATQARLAEATDRTVYVQGDRETTYGRVITIVDRLTAAGVAKVMMVVDRGGRDTPPPTEQP